MTPTINSGSGCWNVGPTSPGWRTKDLPTLKDEYVKAGSPTSAPPISCTEMDEAPEPEPMPWAFGVTFSPKDAITQMNGTILVPVSGIASRDEIWNNIRDNLRKLAYCKLDRNDNGFWRGSLEISLNHADYQFWQWLIQRWPRYSELSAEDIPTLKAEHIKHKAREPEVNCYNTLNKRCFRHELHELFWIDWMIKGTKIVGKLF